MNPEKNEPLSNEVRDTTVSFTLIKVTVLPVKCLQQTPAILNTFSYLLGSSLYWGSTVLYAVCVMI